WLCSTSWPEPPSFPPPQQPQPSAAPFVTSTAAAPWFCSFCWSVVVLLCEVALFSALLHWLTSPLFDPGLSTVTGALTLTCSELASLEAVWLVLFSLLADWLCSTSWPEPPQEPLPPRSLPTADPPWFCWLSCWVSL